MASSPGGAGGSSQPPMRQEVPPNPQLTPCMWCSNPLPHPGAPICNACGRPQKECIKCAEPIPPSYQICPYCHAPQQHETKLCLNPECKKPLLPGAAFCAICQAPQNPAMFQQFHKVDQCIACSTKLLIPGQQMCHACGAPQHTSTSMEHSGHCGQLIAHSPHWHPPPHTIHPPLNFPQSPSEPPSNLPQPQPLFPDVSQSTEQQHLPHGQQSNKRSPEGDNCIANKKSRTDGESGAVSQVSFTSPTAADSAHVHGIAVQPVLPDNPVTSPTTQTTTPHPITKNTASSSPPGSSRPSDPPSQGSPQSAYHTDTPFRPCPDSTSLGTKDVSVPDSPCQSTTSQPGQLVASDHVDPQSPIFPTHYDKTVSIQTCDHPQENRNLPQQPLAIKVNQEKERKRIRSLSPTPQSGDDDSESLCLKKHRAESESHSKSEEPSSEQEKQKISSSAHALPSETDNPISLLDLVMVDKEQLSPACPLPIEAYDPVPSPDLSKDNEQWLPAARALPSKRSVSCSSDDSVPSPNPSNSDNEEYETRHESHPNVDEVDSSTLSSKDVIQVTEKSGLSQKEPTAVAPSCHDPLNVCGSDENEETSHMSSDQKDSNKSKKDKKVFVCYAVTTYQLLSFCCRREKEINHRMITLLKILKRVV